MIDQQSQQLNLESQQAYTNNICSNPNVVLTNQQQQYFQNQSQLQQNYYAVQPQQYYQGFQMPSQQELTPQQLQYYQQQQQIMGQQFLNYGHQPILMEGMNYQYQQPTYQGLNGVVQQQTQQQIIPQINYQTPSSNQIPQAPYYNFQYQTAQIYNPQQVESLQLPFQQDQLDFQMLEKTPCISIENKALQIGNINQNKASSSVPSTTITNPELNTSQNNSTQSKSSQPLTNQLGNSLTEIINNFAAQNTTSILQTYNNPLNKKAQMLPCLTQPKPQIQLQPITDSIDGCNQDQKNGKPKQKRGSKAKTHILKSLEIAKSQGQQQPITQIGKLISNIQQDIQNSTASSTPATQTSDKALAGITLEKLLRFTSQAKKYLAKQQNYQIKVIHDLEVINQRIKNSSKFLNMLFVNLMIGTSTIEKMQQIIKKLRFSFKLSIIGQLPDERIVQQLKDSKNKRSKCKKLEISEDCKIIETENYINYHAFIVDIKSIKKYQNNKDPNFNKASEYCKLLIPYEEIKRIQLENGDKVLFTKELLIKELLILDGLKLEISDDNLLILKFKSDYSQFHFNKDMDSFQIDENQNFEITILEDDEVRVIEPVQNQHSELYNIFKTSIDEIQVQPAIREYSQVINKLGNHVDASQLRSIASLLQYRIHRDVAASLVKKNYKNELLKLYTIEEMFKSLQTELVPLVCGVLKNLQIITETPPTVNQSKTSSEKPKINFSGFLDKLKNKYIGELHSLTDDNYITVILIEEGFSPITQSLLDGDVVVYLKNPKRLMSSNLEIYLETKICVQNINTLGKPADNLLEDRTAIQDFKDQNITSINFISPEIVTRNTLLIKARIIDINFIKFEFTCQLCKGGTLLSSARCINNCKNPRPLLKIFMRITIKDEQGGEAYVSLNDDRCCRVFAIDFNNIDIFKEYFFMHGVFYYKSYQKFTPEYANVLAFFKNAQSQRYYIFQCQPYCKIGYDEQSMFSAMNYQEKLINMIKRCYNLSSSEQAQQKAIQDEFNKQCEQLSMQKQVFVNGEVREAIDFSNRKVLRQILCLKCKKIIDEKKRTKGIRQRKQDTLFNFGSDAFEQIYSRKPN